jgi:hypothetical protein
MLPPWVYDLINSVQTYEDEHGCGHECFDRVLLAIPAEERHAASAIAHYRSETARTEDEREREWTAAQELSRVRMCRCTLTPTPPLTDPDGILNAAMERAVAYNHKYELPRPTEFQLNPADAERFTITDGYWTSKLDELSATAIRVTVDPGVGQGWLWIKEGDKCRATPIDVPAEQQKTEA